MTTLVAFISFATAHNGAGAAPPQASLYANPGPGVDCRDANDCPGESVYCYPATYINGEEYNYCEQGSGIGSICRDESGCGTLGSGSFARKLICDFDQFRRAESKTTASPSSGMCVDPWAVSALSDYTRHEKHCVGDTSTATYPTKDRSLEECAEICNMTPGCVGFEYGVDYGQADGYEGGDCQPQTSADHKCCHERNLDFYSRATSDVSGKSAPVNGRRLEGLEESAPGERASFRRVPWHWSKFWERLFGVDLDDVEGTVGRPFENQNRGADFNIPAAKTTSKATVSSRWAAPKQNCHSSEDCWGGRYCYYSWSGNYCKHGSGLGSLCSWDSSCGYLYSRKMTCEWGKCRDPWGRRLDESSE